MGESKKIRNKSPVPLSKFIPYRMTRISEKLSQSTSNRYKPHGVSSPEWRVLAVLTQYGNASSKFLHTHTAMSKTRINYTLDSLLTKGWASRQLDPADKRQNKISLTPAGKAVFETVGKIAQETQNEWLETFTPSEIDQLYHLLDKLEKNIPSALSDDSTLLHL